MSGRQYDSNKYQRTEKTQKKRRDARSRSPFADRACCGADLSAGRNNNNDMQITRYVLRVRCISAFVDDGQLAERGGGITYFNERKAKRLVRTWSGQGKMVIVSSARVCKH